MAQVESYAQTPAYAAAEDAAKLLTQPVGKRAIVLRGVGERWTNESLFSIVKNKKFDYTADQQWHTEYFEHLKAAGVTPDYIAIDYEGGIGYWQMSRKNLKKIMTTPSLKRKLTLDLQQYTMDDFQYGTPNYTKAVASMNHWAASMRNESLRQALFFPARQVFGHDIAMSNFDDIVTDTPIQDLNGVVLTPEQAVSVAGYSSPALYVTGGGGLYREQSNPQWANFLHDLNKARALNSDTFVPWIADSRVSGHPELWAQMMYHMRATGVKTMLLFNPENYGQTDAEYAQSQTFTREVFQRMQLMPSSYHATGALSQMGMNTRVVTTGSIVTTRGRLNPFINLVTVLRPATGAQPRADIDLEKSSVLSSMADDIVKAA